MLNLDDPVTLVFFYPTVAYFLFRSLQYEPARIILGIALLIGLHALY